MLWFVAEAQAIDADTVVARVAETRPFRSNLASSQRPSFTEDDYRRAAAGHKVTGVLRVEGHTAKVGYGLTVLDVGIDALWAGINSETAHLGLLPMSHVEIVSGTPCADGREVLMVLPLPVVTDRFWINRNSYNGALSRASGGQMRELAWSSVADPANRAMSAAGRSATDGLVPIGFNRGAWLLVSLDATHTLVEYHSWVDPGGSVPAGAASMFATSGIEDTFDAMERYAQGAPLCAGRL